MDIKTIISVVNCALNLLDLILKYREYRHNKSHS